MIEAERKQRNYIKLQELHPAMRVRLEAVIREMEAVGLRPRIQEAWRSPQDQLAAYNAGKSRVKFGFHNVTGADNAKEALAADVWDDNNPLNTKTDFMLRLAAAAENNGLATGIRWDLSDNKAKLIDEAIAAKDWKRPVWVGWDPLHVEITSITIKEAQEGKRPAMPGSEPPGTGSEEPEPPDNPEGETPTPEPENPVEEYEAEIIRYRTENLKTGRVREYDLSTELRPVTLLAVPYVSQLGPGADSRRNDCGAASAVMMIAAYSNRLMTPDAFYDKFNIAGDPYLTVTQVRNALGTEGIPTDFKTNLNLKDLFGFLLAGIPCIVPTRYTVLRDAGLTEKTFSGPHFSVVVGMDLKYIYVHDPLFTDEEEGNARPYPLDIFLKAWTDTTQISGFAIPQRAAIIPAAPIGIRIVKRVRVTAGRLNVRQGPGTNYAVTGFVSLRQEYDLLREVSGWGEIGPDRWIYLAYTETIPSPTQPPTTPGEPGEQNQGAPLGPGQGLLQQVALATSIPQNPTGLRAAEYLFNDPLIPSTQRNLCGDVALSMVYETVTGKTNTLGYIHQGSKGTTRKVNGGTNAYEFAQQFANTFPAGWKASCFYLNYLYYFEAGNPRHLPNSPGALPKSMTTRSAADIKAMIVEMLRDRTYVISGATQSTLMEGAGAARLHPRGVGHWVVVTGATDTYIYINNPFMNRRETYTWDEFLSSFGYWIVQLFPPLDQQPQVYSGPMDSLHASLEEDRNKV